MVYSLDWTGWFTDWTGLDGLLTGLDGLLTVDLPAIALTFTPVSFACMYCCLPGGIVPLRWRT